MTFDSSLCKEKSNRANFPPHTAGQSLRNCWEDPFNIIEQLTCLSCCRSRPRHVRDSLVGARGRREEARGLPLNTIVLVRGHMEVTAHTLHAKGHAYISARKMRCCNRCRSSVHVFQKQQTPHRLCAERLNSCFSDVGQTVLSPFVSLFAWAAE